MSITHTVLLDEEEIKEAIKKHLFDLRYEIVQYPSKEDKIKILRKTVHDPGDSRGRGGEVYAEIEVKIKEDENAIRR